MEQLLTENILTALKNSIGAVKQYGNQIAQATKTHKQLKTLDGSKTWSTENLKQEAIRMRLEIIESVENASPKSKTAIANAIKKMGAAPLAGAYVSRNYYRDFTVYSLLNPLVELSRMKVAKAVYDVLVDKILGFVITAVTGIPAIADLKDAGDVARTLVKTSSEVANKINSLAPAQIDEEASKTTFKRFLAENA